MSDATAPLSPQDAAPKSQGQLVGRFVVLGQLGQGGSGEVFSAFDPVLDRKVAIKLLRSTEGDQAELVREGRLLAKLSHPGVVAVHDAGLHQDRAFLAMELVDGEDLAAWAKPHVEAEQWRTIIDALIAAGHGLAAAHASGLVHGDVKPSNVLVDRSGRARMSDFGIARRVDASQGAEADDTEDTSRARYPGTPAFMAPEQHDGRPADARSDQYSFCLMAWTVLSGTHPYAEAARALSSNAQVSQTRGGTGLSDTATPDGSVALPAWLALAEAQQQWTPTWAGRPRIPRRIVDALVRGLASDPQTRFSDIEALLDALRPDRSSVGQRGTIAAVAVGVIATATAATVGRSAEPVLCTGAADEIATVWNDERRQTVQASLTASQSTFSLDTWERAEPRLVDYAQQWAIQHREACEATRQRGEQSEATMDLRMACLQRARAQFDATLTALTEADATTVRNTPQLLDGLRLPSQCSDIEGLLAQTALPSDPEVATDVEQARAAIALANAQREAGHYQTAVDALEPLVHTVRTLAYPPLSIELATSRGLALMLVEDDEAEALLATALSSALEHEQWDAATDAAIGLTDLVGHRNSRGGEGMAFGATALGLTARQRAPRGTRATAMNAVAMVHQRAGRLPDAEAMYRTAIERATADSGARSSQVATYRANLANILRAASRVDEAETEIREALAIHEQALGAAHPDVALTRSQLGTVLAAKGDFEGATREHQTALAARTDALGERSSDVARSLLSLGAVNLSRGEIDTAQQQLQDAIELFEETLGPDAADGAVARTSLGIALAGRGRFAEAEQQLRLALKIQSKYFGPQHPELATLHDNIGAMLLNQQRYAEAEVEQRAALAIREATLDPVSEPVMTSYGNLAMGLVMQERPADAEPAARRALEIAEQLFDGDHPVLSYARVTQATVLSRLDRHDQALPLLELAWKSLQGPDAAPASRGNAGNRLAKALIATGGDTARARSIAKEAADAYESGGERWTTEVARIREWAAAL